MRRANLQTEFVASLGLIMLAATAILGALLLQANETRLRAVLGPALRAEAERFSTISRSVVPGTQWWRVLPDDSSRHARGSRDLPDTATIALARRARELDRSLLLFGSPWDPIRFAASLGSGGDVAVALLPREASLRLRATPLGLTALFVVLDAAIFTAFGALQVRRRIGLPIAGLADASRRVADGDFDLELSLEGPREVGDVALAFNEMSRALAQRTEALEKAIVDLRSSNRALREAREGLDRAERLAAVGRLASGVAHEVGNPLGALLAFLNLAERDPGLSDESRRHLAQATEQGARVRRILGQLLQYSKPPRAERVALDLAAAAAESVELVAAQRRYAKVTFRVEPGACPLAIGDPGMVAQILLNLVINAADATGDAGGEVLLLVRPAAWRTRAADARPTLAQRAELDAVECVVCDQGSGIAPEDRERIFDPFFTTKAPGEGTGLGLANSSRLAEQLGGQLELVEPESGYRTALALRLPVWDADPKDPASSCEVRTALRRKSSSESVDT